MKPTINPLSGVYLVIVVFVVIIIIIIYTSLP